MAHEHKISVRSPGKLFLLGEYAVLYGAPAIVQAVDRYVEVTVEEVTGSAAVTTIEVFSCGAQLAPLKISVRDDGLFSAPASEHALVMTVLNALFTQGVLHKGLGSFRCTVDSRALFHQHNKLGLGSSAAIAHALTQAVFAYAKRSNSVKPLPVDFVFNVHREFQHGRGSGADVGAGVMGGTFSYRFSKGHPLPDMASVKMPSELHKVPVWAGKPASTSKALRSLSEFESNHPESFATALAPLVELAESGCNALFRGEAERFIQRCEEYGHNLSEFGRTVGVDIVSASHRELRKIAADCGVVYKPSGAGNGDIGLGYSLDFNALEAFTEAASTAGFARLTLGLGEACHQI